MRKYITAAAALVSLMCALATQANEDRLRLEWHLPYGSIAHSTDIPGAGRGSSFSVSANEAGGFSACAENDGEGWGSGSLTPSGTEQLKQITELNYGSVLELSVDGIYAVKAAIFSTIDSGVVRVNHPSPELLDKLKRY